MDANHTGVNIAEVLSIATEEWGLQKGVLLVSNNASNMTVVGKEFGMELHVGCFAHTLNLGCQCAIKIASVAQLLGGIRHKAATTSYS